MGFLCELFSVGGLLWECEDGGAGADAGSNYRLDNNSAADALSHSQGEGSKVISFVRDMTLENLDKELMVPCPPDFASCNVACKEIYNTDDTVLQSCMSAVSKHFLGA